MGGTVRATEWTYWMMEIRCCRPCSRPSVPPALVCGWSRTSSMGPSWPNGSWMRWWMQLTGAATPYCSSTMWEPSPSSRGGLTACARPVWLSSSSIPHCLVLTAASPSAPCPTGTTARSSSQTRRPSAAQSTSPTMPAGPCWATRDSTTSTCGCGAPAWPTWLTCCATRWPRPSGMCGGRPSMCLRSMRTACMCRCLSPTSGRGGGKSWTRSARPPDRLSSR
mmetsp:Transcript_26947/g.67116  ORF Transcript_26947/g.67116 Transcript_26947/m.67116 type:complete len:222 (-) Transcript_26947:693-1358(-)